MKLPPRILILCLIVLIMFSAPSCSLVSDAKISGMMPGMSEMMDKLECWLTIEFRRYPDNINLQDVKVVFSSIALFNDQTFDWRYIAANDQIAQGLGKGHRPNEESQPGQDPPLKTKIKVNYPLQARPRLENLDKTITLEATLFWGGKKQGSLSTTIEHVYQRERE
jgi:hypothetical protein